MVVAMEPHCEHGSLEGCTICRFTQLREAARLVEELLFRHYKHGSDCKWTGMDGSTCGGELRKATAALRKLLEPKEAAE